MKYVVQRNDGFDLEDRKAWVDALAHKNRRLANIHMRMIQAEHGLRGDKMATGVAGSDHQGVLLCLHPDGSQTAYRVMEMMEA